MFSLIGINTEEALTRPILYSNWLTKNYVPVKREELRDYVKARLKVRIRNMLQSYHMLINFFVQ